MNCTPKQNADGTWTCPECGWTSGRPYPRPPVRKCRPPGAAPPPRIRSGHPPGGPGTELSAIIARFAAWLPWLDLAKHEGCSCDDTARQMDAMGPDQCEQHMDHILDRLEAEARSRGLNVPFRRQAARTLVRLAIRRARK